ncbi:MAG: 6,7-dimethyl-8-ribityllumazine synthase [Gaiellales bacterium]
MTAPDAAAPLVAPAGTVRLDPVQVDAGVRVAVVAAEYHTDIVQPLVDGAVGECVARGVDPAGIALVPVPGAFEVGLAAKRCAQAGYDAVIVLACVIRGDTPHFEYVSQEAARGVAEAALQTGVPVAFGVLTVETHQQAVDRIGGSEGHKGREAAAAALDLLGTLRAL